MVTIKDIAARAGVSCGTVTFAFKGPTEKGRHDISEARRQEILRLAREMGYRPNRSAKFLQEGKTGAVAVVFPQGILAHWAWRQNLPLALEIIQGIQEELDGHNYEAILLMPTQEQTERVFRRKVLDERRVDGVVLFGDAIFSQFLPEIIAHRIPTISFWSEARAYGIPVVLWDPQPGIEELVEAAYRLGHRRAGCIFTDADRKALFVARCRALGIEVPETACRAVVDEVGAALATQALAQQADRPSLVFYTSDHQAVAGLQTLAQLGVRVPEDMSVAGLDNNLNLPAEVVPLATVENPRRERGRLAARVLMDRIRGTPNVPPVFMLKSRFIPRRSLGPAVKHAN